MNAELYGNTYPIPKEILNKINAKIYTNPTGNGIKRAKSLINSGVISYEQMKRLKNFFDTFNSQTTSKDELDYAGGNEMRTFIEHQLGTERDRTAKSAEIKKPIKVANSLGMGAPTGDVELKENNKYRDKTFLVNERPEDNIKRRKIPESENKDTSETLTKNALAIIFNDDMEVLLLQRSSYKDQWMPQKWALVGGGVEDGEEPIDAVKREIKEETNLDIQNFKESFVLQRNEDSIEHMFVTKYDGNDNDVKINEEHQDFGWFDVNNINKLDIVPNLLDYIRIAIQKYE